MSYEQALEDFSAVQHLTYFDSAEHVTIGDLCYLCLHELDLHAEGEYWHPMKERRALLKFCQKWGPQTADGMDYAKEAEVQFYLGKDKKKSEAYTHG
jgi:hypothetical protein